MVARPAPAAQELAVRARIVVIRRARRRRARQRTIGPGPVLLELPQEAQLP